MSDTIEKYITCLEVACQKDPGLIDTINLHCALLKAQRQAATLCPPHPPTIEDAEQALQQGVPLLHLAPPPFDWFAISQLAVDVCRIIAEHRPELIESLTKVNHHLAGQNRQIERLVTCYLYGESWTLAIDEELPDPSLLTFILTYTLRPFLQSVIRNLQPHQAYTATSTRMRVGQMSRIHNLQSKINMWGHPICPMCGGPTDFAALVSTNGDGGYGRRLLCARCDTEWGYQRSGCPFCKQVEQWTCFPDENEVFRLYVCDACHRYLKTVDWRQTFAHRSLPVARVITINMDLAAAQAGYS